MDKSIDLEVVITAVDEASAKLESIGKSAGALGKQLGVAGLALGGALAYAVKQASDAQVSLAKVDATLGTLGDAGKKAREGILRASEATQKLGFDNDESAVSLANLFQRTGDVNKAIKLNALAMDLARAKNIDLTTATTLVGQVLSGNGKILKQYGIDIKDSATPIEALGILQGKVGGQAQAFSTTFTGAMGVVKVQLDDLAKVVGQQLLPVLTNFINQAKPIVEGIMAWAKAHPELTQNIVLATGALAGLLLVLSPILIGMSLITPAMLVAGAVIAILALGVYELIKNWDTLKPALLTVWEQMKNIGAVVYDFLKPAIDFLVITLQLLWTQLKYLWDLISPVLLPVLKYMAIFLGATLVGAIAILIGSIGAIALVIAGFIEGLKLTVDWLSNVYLWIATNLPKALTMLQTAWTTSWNAIKDTTMAVVDFIMAKVDAVIGAWNRAQALVSAPITAVTGAVKGTVGAVVQAVAGKRADGGTVNAGSSYLVGERGAEVFTPNTSGYITPNGGGGSIVVNINGGTYLSENVAVQIGDMIVNRLKMTAKLRV